MATEFGTGKTLLVLTIVFGCFAVLWPKLFYPMLQSSISIKPDDCCDVIFEKDLNAIKIMTQLCEKILSSQPDFDKRFLMSFQQGKLTREIVNRCNAEVHKKCDVDIREFLMEKVRLGKTYQQMLSELRTLNSSFCLKANFGVSPGLIGAPRRMRIWETKTLRQERPNTRGPHKMHPAMRERGRAIPHSHVVPRVVEDKPSSHIHYMPGKRPPMPGMRPPMGGAGHMAPPPKGSSTMGFLLPLYTIGIVVFFIYTMMKLMVKRSDERTVYSNFRSDPEFRRMVFQDVQNLRQKPRKASTEVTNTKLVVSAISSLVAEVNQDIRSEQDVSVDSAEDQSTTAVDEKPVEEESKAKVETTIEDNVEEKVVEQIELEKLENVYLDNSRVSSEDKTDRRVTDFDEKPVGKSGSGAVQVVGIEMTESVEGGQKWSRPSTPLTPRSTTPQAPPQSIYLEGSLPSQSQLLVSQSEIAKLSQESEESPVILAGKVTLSLIGMDDGVNSGNGGPVITLASSNESSECGEEEVDLDIDYEDEENIEQDVSEEEAEVVDNNVVNGEEDLTTNYTTASAALGVGDETEGDFSVMEQQNDEEEDNKEIGDSDINEIINNGEPIQSLEKSDAVVTQSLEKIDSIFQPTETTAYQNEDNKENVEYVGDDEEEEEEEEEEEDEEEVEGDMKEEVEEEVEETDNEEEIGEGEFVGKVKGPAQEIALELNADKLNDTNILKEKDIKDNHESTSQINNVPPKLLTANQSNIEQDEDEEEEEEEEVEDENEEESEEEDSRPQTLQQH